MVVFLITVGAEESEEVQTVDRLAVQENSDEEVK